MEIIDVNTLFGAYPSQHPDSTPESLLAVLESQAVSRCFALSTWGLFHNDQEGNAETLRACREHSALIPVATVNPTGYWGQRDVLSALRDDGFLMFRFFPKSQRWPLEFAPFSYLLTELARGPQMPVMVDMQRLGDVTALARIAADYPYPVILGDVSTPMLTEAIAVLRARPNFYLETHALLLPDALPLLRDTVGVERLLFGSNAPGMSLGAALRAVTNSALTEGEKEAVLSGNARRLWPNLTVGVH